MLQSASAQSMAHPQKVEISMDGCQCVELSSKHIDRSPPPRRVLSSEVLQRPMLLPPRCCLTHLPHVYPAFLRPAGYFPSPLAPRAIGDLVETDSTIALGERDARNHH